MNRIGENQILDIVEFVGNRLKSVLEGIGVEIRCCGIRCVIAKEDSLLNKRLCELVEDVCDVLGASADL